MWQKFTTALVVVLLSGLIWVFAEQSVTKTASVPVKIELNQSHDNLLIQLVDDQGQPQPSMQVELEVEGPNRTIQELAAQTLAPQLAPLTLEQIDYQESQNEFTREVISLLDETLTFGDDVTLLVIGARPSQIQFRVLELEQATLNVKVYDQESRNPLEVETLNPQTVTAFVQAGTTPDAKIFLNAAQQLQAADVGLTVDADVSLLGRTHQSFPVSVKLATGAGSSWPEDSILSAQIRINILKPATMVGKYEIESVDEFIGEVQDIYGPIRFQGTSQACQDYRNGVHLTLEIKDYDAESDKMGGSR
ncbi:MAG: hypothetical protein GY869_02155, partial [Planctomycetes bacterium]|nr:hypothetical protein [Planctomycetota bacterium]